MKMVTKFQLMNLAEKVICGENPTEFVEAIANNYQAVTRFLANDENFRSSFLVSCVRVGNVSSYLYQFLASVELVGSDRPTTFATIMNLLWVTLSPKPHHRLMMPFLMKVTILLGFMLSGAQALEFSVESTSDHVLINTPVNTAEYVEFTEEFTLEPMYEQMMRINESLSLIKGLMKFSTQNNDCHDVGN